MGGDDTRRNTLFLRINGLLRVLRWASFLVDWVPAIGMIPFVLLE